ncbi:clarin-3 [Dicentrarchus labrax]|uniref:Clarin 3 n=1 Tax=Dicentrarchus labrax TaxID=13489 RepID=A0A8C4GY91_DICLA|nr:clarin-3 [Dicentrarchus labrax]
MPSIKKILHFMSSAWVTAISVGILGYGMSTDWSKTTMECARRGSDFFNGTAELTLELFSGNLERTFCPSFGGSVVFPVIPKLVETGVTPVVLHALALCLLVLCLVFSAASILISLYNSVSNPYETYMGPVGIYACSSLCACLSVVVLILFVVNVNVTNLAEELVNEFATTEVDLKNKSSEMQLGYYLVIPYTVLSLVAIVLIYMYDHAAYTQRREQQRPTEDAPKEIMMY